MAVTPNSNEAFLREVDEELRRDQAAKLMRRYGLWAIVAVIVALALLAGFLFWQHRQGQAAEREAEQLQASYDSITAGNAAAAAKPLDTLAKSPTEGYRTLAVFQQANLLLGQNDLKAAAAKFASIASDDSIARPFRDLALIRQTTAEFDTLKPDVAIARLRGLATKGSPWFGSAGELVAAAYMRQGRRDLAGQMFARLAADEAIPASIRQRAVQMAGLLGGSATSATQPSAKQETAPR